jgi:hypothetical protein
MNTALLVGLVVLVPGATRRTGKKVKRKLNLSPERGAQLAAAMKARWTAKRSAAEANPQNVVDSPSLTGVARASGE